MKDNIVTAKFVFRNLGRGRRDAAYIFEVTEDGQVLSSHGPWNKLGEFKSSIAFTSPDHQVIETWLIKQFKKRLGKGYWPVKDLCKDPWATLNSTVIGQFHWQPEDGEPSPPCKEESRQLSMFGAAGTDIVKVIPLVETMRPYGLSLDDERWTRTDHIIEWKEDGHSGQVIFDAAGRVHFFKGNGKDIMAHFPSFLVPALAGTHLHIEYVAPFDGRSISTDASTFVARDGYKRIKGGFVILDVVVWKGKDVMAESYQKRAVYRQTANYDLVRSPLPFRLPERKACDEHTKFYIEQWVKRGAEGAVLKGLHDPYEPGKSKLWAKWKHRPTVDCWVRSYREGTGKYAGLVGALILNLVKPDGSLAEVGACSGMTDALRRELTDRLLAGEEFAVEVAFDRWTRENRLVMPQFSRMRPDRQASDCTTDKQAPERTF